MECLYCSGVEGIFNAKLRMGAKAGARAGDEGRGGGSSSVMGSVLFIKDSSFFYLVFFCV